MGKFIKKVLLAAAFIGIILLAAVAFFFAVISPQYLYGYQAAVLDKIERLESLDSPKIILVGNSNIAYGICSEDIEEAFGMSVVNLGLHGGLGNEFHENMAKYNIQEGDLVILCHKSYSLEAGTVDWNLVWITIENHFHLWKLVRPEDYLNALEALPKYIKSSFYLWLRGEGNVDDTTTVYSRSAFNEYGDISYPRMELEYTFTYGSVDVPGVSDEEMERVNQLNAYCNDIGATLLIACYPIADGEFTPDHSAYIEFWDEVCAAADCDVISDIEDYFFDYSYFYNTDLHLNDEGAKLRTAQLIEDLREWQEGQG
ncbi:MAG: hypothetical protein LUE16_08085 [Lachnospiraceae bacterium]|nr:hypothetical protein [Lachnospiraceae bacterium]